MVVLGSSVLVGAISLYNRSSSNTPTYIVNQSQLNEKLNSIVDLCMKSLPAGPYIHVCDKQLKVVVTQVCANDVKLDICHNAKVDQYYKSRAAEVPNARANRS